MRYIIVTLALFACKKQDVSDTKNLEALASGFESDDLICGDGKGAANFDASIKKMELTAAQQENLITSKDLNADELKLAVKGALANVPAPVLAIFARYGSITISSELVRQYVKDANALADDSLNTGAITFSNKNTGDIHIVVMIPGNLRTIQTQTVRLVMSAVDQILLRKVLVDGKLTAGENDKWQALRAQALARFFLEANQKGYSLKRFQDRALEPLKTSNLQQIEATLAEISKTHPVLHEALARVVTSHALDSAFCSSVSEKRALEKFSSTMAIFDEELKPFRLNSGTALTADFSLASGRNERGSYGLGIFSSILALFGGSALKGVIGPVSKGIGSVFGGVLGSLGSGSVNLSGNGVGGILNSLTGVLGGGGVNQILNSVGSVAPGAPGNAVPDMNLNASAGSTPSISNLNVANLNQQNNECTVNFGKDDLRNGSVDNGMCNVGGKKYPL